MGSDLFLPMTSSHRTSHFLASRLLHLSLSFAAVAGVNAETLWPEFMELSKILKTYLDDVTERVIAKGVFADGGEEDVVSGDFLE